MMRGPVVGALSWCLASLLAAVPAAAQSTRLTLGGFSGAMGNTTVADFDQGFRDSGSNMTFTTQITAGNQQRVTSVFVRANSATLGGTKPVSDLLWRRADLVTWVPFTTSNALIESRTIQTNGTQWVNGIALRCLVNWTDDPTPTYSVTITFTLVVTAP
jgi:hypothetical protein